MPSNVRHSAKRYLTFCRSYFMSVFKNFAGAQRLFALIALFAFAGFATALFAQHVLAMRPCAWCVFQRLILIGCFLFSVLGLFTTRARQLGLSYLSAALLIATALGGVIAAWHQYTVAAHSFSCAQTFADRAVQWLGLEQALPAVFGIYASCMEAQVDFLGLDFALWALLSFALISFGTLLILWRLVARPQ